MEDQDKFVSAVARLNELTQEGKLKWFSHLNPEQLNLGTDKKVKLVFQTQYKGKTLRIYQEDYKFWVDENHFEWDSKVVLAFVDINDRNIWNFPEVAGLNDLYESVRFQEAGVDKFIDEILAEDN